MADASPDVQFFSESPKGTRTLENDPVKKRKMMTMDRRKLMYLLFRGRSPLRADNKLHFLSGISSSKKMESPEVETAFHFESSKEIQVQSDNRATARLETDTSFDRDARAIRERSLKLAPENLKGNVKSDDKLGIRGYTDYKAGFRREQTVASEKAGGAHGPLWGVSPHIRDFDEV